MGLFSTSGWLRRTADTCSESGHPIGPLGVACKSDIISMYSEMGKETCGGTLLISIVANQQAWHLPAIQALSRSAVLPVPTHNWRPDNHRGDRTH
jgi:hypothetical protein